METHTQEKSRTINTQTPTGKKNPKQEASPSSTSSSPSHEFSFAISLQPLPSSCSKPNPNHLRTTSKTTSSTDPFAVDLSPADDIFFHGHLLPLHLLSHIPISPRTSTGSLDGFALPVKDILHDKPTLSHDTITTDNNNSSGSSSLITKSTSNIIENGHKTGVFEGTNRHGTNRGKNKPIRSFSLFNLSKWRKGFEDKDRDDEQEGEENKTKQQKKKKMKLVSLDLSHALKKYIRMLFHRRENRTQFMMRRRQAYSFSSASAVMTNSRTKNDNSGYNINGGRRKDLRGRRRIGEFSAPASMRTSPTNSGHLRGISTTSSSNSCSSSSDSTMEELQAAIQAAIAHCKNSNAPDRDDNNKVNN
ncbi:PREDICTED: BRI1 kinase inhibitor 1-like [Tarenaya hassleriana]|uniref:BRI1 kinase inhibitor 1-like n=1 Tax=Tarenaya hassleriana TaxID=28532 RepID=UPI00053C23C0|nr:PREDICTED: BRI1 kinase inhibitor 1-like [Tarenaya hassleriana]